MIGRAAQDRAAHFGVKKALIERRRRCSFICEGPALWSFIAIVAGVGFRIFVALPGQNDSNWAYVVGICAGRGNYSALGSLFLAAIIEFPRAFP